MARPYSPISANPGPPAGRTRDRLSAPFCADIRCPKIRHLLLAEGIERLGQSIRRNPDRKIAPRGVFPCETAIPRLRLPALQDVILQHDVGKATSREAFAPTEIEWIGIFGIGREAGRVW